MIRRKGLFGIGVVLVAAAGFLSVYWTGGSVPISEQASPDGRERVAFVTPTRGQALFLTYDMPARARLIAGDKDLGTSAPFDLSGQGEIFWDKNQVQVGTSAVFDRTTGDWTIILY